MRKDQQEVEAEVRRMLLQAAVVVVVVVMAVEM
jgi:hypothetical protein